jgi:isoquinoline 1-oxidoreductase beta subunit
MLSRRGFILSGAAVGGGLVIAYASHRLDDGDATEKFAASGRAASPLNAWIKITSQGEIICAIHRAEMGQGITTGIAQLLIEELDGDWNNARFEFPPVDRDYYNFGILEDGRPFGDPDASLLAGAGTWAMREMFHAIGLSLTAASVSIIDAWDTVRPAGAAARQMLIAAAARRWNCDPPSLITEAGVVIDAAGNRRATYGDLAEAAAQEEPPSDPPLKNPADYRLVGHDVPRLDTPAKVSGTAMYGSDVVLPNMLYAAIVHSPVIGTRVAGFDGSEAAREPGVTGVVTAGEFAVAVVAADTWTAMRAAEQVRVDALLETGDGTPIIPVDTDGLGEAYLAMLNEQEPVVIREEGTADAAIASNDRSIDVVYELPYLTHECMEPMNCTALYTGDALEVWAGSQGNSIARDTAARVAGLSNDQVRFHSTFMGGGFGRRAEMDFVEQATAVAIQFPGRPIKLTWSRPQDIRHGTTRPAAVARVRGAVGANGSIAMNYAVAAQSVSASYGTRVPSPRRVDDRDDRYIVAPSDRPAYRIDNMKVWYVPVRAHVPVGYWRSVSHTINPFFLECFIDELAASVDTDPLTFRRQALADQPRHLAVLDALDEFAGPATQPRGYAINETHGSVVAHAVEVETRGGAQGRAQNVEFARVARVFCVVDCGRVLHPDNVVAQTEGCIFDGLANALQGRLEIADGIVQQQNLRTYDRFKLDEQPEIHVHLVSSERRPGGVGEVAIPGAAPALCNAIYAATGKRIRKLPINFGPLIN